METKYYRTVVSAILSRYLSILATLGWNDDVARQCVNELNTFFGKGVISVSELKREFVKSLRLLDESIPADCYYDSRVPRTHRLILRDKLFYASRKIISDIIRIIESNV